MAHRLADQAAQAILPHFRTGCAVDHKQGSSFDPVTEADRAAETVLRAAIQAAYPTHGIIGEEFGSQNPEAEYCWVLDPIDGTRAFIVGQPLWGSLIGLLRDGEPLLGMMDQPFTGERFWSSEDESLYRRGEKTVPMRTRACAGLQEAMLAASTPDMFDPANELPRFEALTRSVRMRRFGGDCYNYCLLALGQLDLVAEAGLKNHDILPLIPIITRAGGIVTDWDGGACRSGGQILAAGDARLHDAALEALAR